MSYGDLSYITFSIAVVITELYCDPEEVCRDLSRPFELSIMCKATAALIQSCVWMKAASKSVFL